VGIADFLFNGKAPQSVTTYGSKVTNVPQWFTDFQQGIAAKGNAIASMPYEPYGAPRIQNFNQDQQNAFNLTRNGMGAESNAIYGAMGNAMNAGRNANSLGDAQPYMAASGQGAYSTVNKYMNPYNEAVTNRIAQLGARNLSENLMPAINQDFIRAGQYGSTGQMNEVGKALRDTQESVLAQQSELLQQGYNSAMGYAQNDLNRYGQLAQTAGNLSNADTSAQIDASKVAGGLGSIAQDARYADINALSGVGSAIQGMGQKNLDMAYKDFIDQRDYQMNQLSWLNNLIKGFEMPTSTYTSDTGPLPGAGFSPSPVQSALGAGLAAYNMLR